MPEREVALALFANHNYGLVATLDDDWHTCYNNFQCDNKRSAA